MAIDDILVTPDTQCFIPTTTTTLPTTTTPGRHTPLSCDFENNTCKWTDDTSVNGRWKRRQGQASSSSFGPTYGKNRYPPSGVFSNRSFCFSDHTLQSVGGWFLDTSDLKVNQTARLLSTLTSIGQNGICFRFWHRVYGSKQGKLNILQRSSNETNATLIYTIRPNLDIDWREAMVFRDTQGNYQLIIEAIAGNVLMDSDNIAVDDITTSEGREPQWKEEKRKDLKFPCSGPCPFQRFCDFEASNICGYTNSPSGTIDWTRHSGTTTSWYTGPPYDHTTFTSEGIDLLHPLAFSTFFSLGHYMFIETSLPSVAGDVARLISPRYPASTEYNCLQFYYHQYGADVDTLNVFKLDIGGSLNPVKLFTAQGNRFNEWHVVEVNFVPNKPYNIIFEGNVGKSFEGVCIRTNESVTGNFTSESSRTSQSMISM